MAKKKNPNKRSTDLFQEQIKAYLDKQAENDSQFKKKYEDPKKSIEDCCTYILNQVQKAKVIGWADEEIFGMAMHYYDEEEIEVGKKISARVVINRAVELTAEEIAQAKQEAIQKVHQETRESEALKKKGKAEKRNQKLEKEKKKEESFNSQQSLF